MVKSKRVEIRLTQKDLIVLRELKQIWAEKSDSSTVRKSININRDNEHERQADIGRIKEDLAKKNIRIGELMK